MAEGAQACDVCHQMAGPAFPTVSASTTRHTSSTVVAAVKRNYMPALSVALLARGVLAIADAPGSAPMSTWYADHSGARGEDRNTASALAFSRWELATSSQVAQPLSRYYQILKLIITQTKPAQFLLLPPKNTG